MSVEIHGKDYSFLIDEERAPGNNATQKVLTPRLNKLGKDLMTVEDFYTLIVFAQDILENNGNQKIKGLLNKTIKSLKEDLKNELIITGTGIKYYKSFGNIMHHKYSTITHWTGSQGAEIPFYLRKNMDNVEINSREEIFLKQLLRTSDNIKFMTERMTYFVGKKPVIIKMQGNDDRKNKYLPITLDSSIDDFYINGYYDINYVGCARGVQYINKTVPKNISINDIITNEGLTDELSSKQKNMLEITFKEYNITKLGGN